MQISSSNIEWRAYGKIDYGASGDLDRGTCEWAMLRDHLEQYKLRGYGRAVEIGCGNGRLTQSIARDFRAVEALDVSEDRLARARGNVSRGNVCWHLVDEPRIPAKSGSADLVVSTHVIQHIEDRNVVQAYFAESYRVLHSGGVLLMHIPVPGAHGSTARLGEVMKRTAKEWAKAAVLRATRILMRAGLEKLPWKVDFYRWYDYPSLRTALEGIGFSDVEVRLLPWAGGHSYVLARRSDSV